ncbi:MAG: hypothetical protein ACI9FB_001126 [Candidatus Azotimanducaceae bacterium]|jgi:hypothetical protein
MLSNRFLSALFITVFLFTANHISMQLPAVKPATAPSNEFSGARAYTILSSLLREDRPHPTGSALNKIVRARIIKNLLDNGIEAETQKTWACAFRFSSCAFVENIIAVIPGRSEGPVVALMSHYDSVPMAPGAGDDGAAVAAMLETARILKAEAPFEHSILLVFTDAEEQGLIGAEGFFANSQYAKNIGILLNYEGSGSTGLSQVLRTSGYNGQFIDAFQRESLYPRGASLISEIFKLMPNDTDFSAVQRANIPGMDFAFASERSHYHTPLDNLAEIDIRTLQHHGENMLPITRWLANNLAEAQGADSNLVYANFYSIWLQWPSNLSPYLLALALLLLGIGIRRSDSSLAGTLGGTAAAVLVLVFTMAFGALTFTLISIMQGTTVSWPADVSGYRLAFFSSTLTGGLCAAIIINKFLSKTNALIGAWCFWCIPTALLVFLIPDASNILLAPLIAGAFTIFAGTFVPPTKKIYIHLLGLVILIPATLGLLFALEESQGYRLIVGALPFIGLFMTIFCPLILGDRLINPLILASLLTIVGVVLALTSPLYSENRPQHVNINYFEDKDKGIAHYQLQSNNSLPKKLTDLIELDSEKKKLIPFLNKEQRHYYIAEQSIFSEPSAELIDITQDDNLRIVELIISSPRQADIFQIVTPSISNLSHFSLDGVTFSSKNPKNAAFDGVNVIKISGMYDRKISLKLFFKTNLPVDTYIVDISTRLPISANKLLENRPPLASPVHRGDQALIYRAITF